MNTLDRFCLFYKDLKAVDLAQLNEIYSTDVEFVDPVAAHQGIESVHQYFHNLLESVSQCEFDISNVAICETNKSKIDAVVTWQMHIKQKPSSDVITLDGISVLKIADDKINYHRDYYDIGQMVYEHIPILGSVIRFIKRKLSS